MRRYRTCKKCDQPVSSGGLCEKHRYAAAIAQEAEYEASPAGTLDKVVDLDELKAWIREHLL